MGKRYERKSLSLTRETGSAKTIRVAYDYHTAVEKD